MQSKPTPAGGFPLRSNVVGTYGSPTNAPSLKCGFFGGWSGIGLCAAFFHRGLIPLCGGGFLRCRSKNLLLSPLEVLGRCLSACRVFYFPQPFFPGIAKELLAARRGSPTNAPCLRHKPAYAGRCGGYSRSLRSLKCGREPTVPPTNAPLPDRSRKSFPGIAKELLAARHFFKKGGLTVLLLYGL